MESKKPMSERDMEEQLQGLKMVMLGQTGGDQEAMMRALAGKGAMAEALAADDLTRVRSQKLPNSGDCSISTA